MTTGILFDLDGTLLNTLEDLTDSTNYALAQFGCAPRTCEQIRSFVGNGAMNQIRLSLPGTPEDPPAEQVLAVYKEYYTRHAQIKTRPYEGVMDALAEIRKHHPIGVVSNKPDNVVKQLCRKYLGDVFALGETPDCPRKPDPRMLYRAKEAIGADRCIYVGDSEVDVLTAAKAGMPCLSVLWGFRDMETIQKAGGSHFCREPRMLAAALEQLI